MNRRLLGFAALAGVMGAVCIRLGIWQLDRLKQRRAENARIEQQLALPPVAVEQLRGAADPTNRRAIVRGIPDTANEFVLTGRARNGSPGVHVVTPMRVPGSDSAVLVIRGWVYAPDAATVDLSRWRESRTEFSGYTMAFGEGYASGVQGRTMRRLAPDGVARVLPYPAARTYIVAQDSSGPSTPARVSQPVLGNGPHLSYAIQWFSFAAIALGGAVLVVTRSRRTTATRGGSMVE